MILDEEMIELTAARGHCVSEDAGCALLSDDPYANSVGVTVDAPGLAIADLLRRIGMLVVPSDMELPEEMAEEGDS